MAATILAFPGVNVTASRPVRLERWAERIASREEQRLNIILTWWEDELAALYRNRVPSQAWRRAFAEAREMVALFHAKMADAVACCEQVA